MSTRSRENSACRQQTRPSRTERPEDWTPPSKFCPPEVMTEAEVAEAEAELKDLQRHLLELVDPKVTN